MFFMRRWSLVSVLICIWSTQLLSASLQILERPSAALYSKLMRRGDVRFREAKISKPCCLILVWWKISEFIRLLEPFLDIEWCTLWRWLSYRSYCRPNNLRDLKNNWELQILNKRLFISFSVLSDFLSSTMTEHDCTLSLSHWSPPY